MTSTGAPSRPATANPGVSREDRLDSPEQVRDELIGGAVAAAPELAELIRLYYRYVPAEEVIEATSLTTSSANTLLGAEPPQTHFKSL